MPNAWFYDGTYPLTVVPPDQIPQEAIALHDLVLRFASHQNGYQSHNLMSINRWALARTDSTDDGLCYFVLIRLIDVARLITNNYVSDSCCFTSDLESLEYALRSFKKRLGYKKGRELAGKVDYLLFKLRLVRLENERLRRFLLSFFP